MVSIIGGLAFFLFGMNIMSSGLKKVAGDRLESVLQKMTDSPIKGLIFGAVITIAMQSSSALCISFSVYDSADEAKEMFNKKITNMDKYIIEVHEDYFTTWSLTNTFENSVIGCYCLDDNYIYFAWEYTGEMAQRIQAGEEIEYAGPLDGNPHIDYMLNNKDKAQKTC